MTEPTSLFPDESPPSSDAVFSSCGRYRYLLTRIWDYGLDMVVWLMLNPSTADAVQNDRTVWRCIRFSQRWGYGGLYVLNIYGVRSTDPVAIRSPDAVGPDNDRWIRDTVAGRPVIAAWGAHARRDRIQQVLPLLSGAMSVECLGYTQHGQPRHPLMVRGDVERQRFEVMYD